MRAIIAGSRDFTDYQYLQRVMDIVPFPIYEVVSGGAKGVDELGERWANENEITIQRFPANWKQHGKAAGPLRNKQMAEYADALIAIRVNNSRGTTNMMRIAAQHRLQLLIVDIRRS